MPWIALAVMINSTLEEFDRLIETALPARHSPVEGLNVAERHIVIRLAQHFFSRLRDAHRFFPFALLKQEPALEHLHNRRHPQMPQPDRQVSPLTRIDQRFVVFASSPQATTLPETSDGQQKPVVQLFPQAP